MATKKRKCNFGEKCYRKNKEHLENYEHPPLAKKQAREEDEEKKKLMEKNENIEEATRDDTEESKEAVNDFDDVRKLVLEENKMSMPEDFYEFLEFCRSIDSKDPKNALKTAGIQLVGLYDLILSATKTDYKLYYRYFYDPPEFQTVLKGSDETLLHFGYYRDDPNELPDFVASNEASVDCKITSRGENLFSAVNSHIEDLIKSGNENIKELKDLQKKLAQWAEKHKFRLELKTAKTKSRDKRMNCKTFHDAGICVAVDSRGFGYRELPERYDSLKKTFTGFCLTGDAPNIKAKKSKAEESIQELMTLTQFANDESDYGMALELGHCMFSFGNTSLHKYIKNLLSISYTLLGRNHYSDVIKAHLNNRPLVI